MLRDREHSALKGSGRLQGSGRMLLLDGSGRMQAYTTQPAEDQAKGGCYSLLFNILTGLALVGSLALLVGGVIQGHRSDIHLPILPAFLRLGQYKWLYRAC
jgi:hypothetical protein